jgi:hypothetical protein
MVHNQIQFRAKFAINEGKLEEFKNLVQDMSRVVEASEPDTELTSFISIKLRQSVLYMKHTQIQKLSSLIITALLGKQYFQGFLVSPG